MGLWPRLLARLLAFGNKLLNKFDDLSSESSFSSPKKWREGVYFEWENTGVSPKPFALVQSGSEEYDKAQSTLSHNAMRYSAKDDAVKNQSLDTKKRGKGIEIIVPRSQAGVVSARFFTDFFVNTVQFITSNLSERYFYVW